MASPRWLAGAVVLAALVSHPGALAQGAPDTYVLDEYNVDLFGAQDSGRIALGLGFGTAYANGLWWTAGPRLSYLKWGVDAPDVRGLGVGGAFGLGWHPQGVVSPYAGITLDRAFSVDGAFDWQTTVHAGARVKVSTDPREHYTMTFSVYHANVFGGDGGGGGDTGIAVLYSAVLFAKHR